MKNALFALFGFLFGIIGATFIVTNPSQLFTDATGITDGIESHSEIISMLDGMLENKKFNNLEYNQKIIEKTDEISDIFPEDSIISLSMRYISANLKIKNKLLKKQQMEEEEKSVTLEEVIEIVAHDENYAPPAKEESENEVKEEEKPEKNTEKTTSLGYFGSARAIPGAEDTKENEEVSSDSIGIFSIGAQDRPVGEVTTPKEANSFTYTYKMDGDLFTPSGIPFSCTNLQVKKYNLEQSEAEAKCEKSKKFLDRKRKLGAAMFDKLFKQEFNLETGANQ